MALSFHACKKNFFDQRIGIAYNANANDYNDNIYSTSQWEKLEIAGSIFLPVTGYRIGKEWKEKGVNSYCSSSYKGNRDADDYKSNYNFSWASQFSLNSGEGTGPCKTGRPVRLVQDVK